MNNTETELEIIRADTNNLIVLNCIDIGRLAVTNTVKNDQKINSINQNVKILSSILYRIDRLLGNLTTARLTDEDTGVEPKHECTGNNS